MSMIYLLLVALSVQCGVNAFFGWALAIFFVSTVTLFVIDLRVSRRRKRKVDGLATLPRAYLARSVIQVICSISIAVFTWHYGATELAVFALLIPFAKIPALFTSVILLALALGATTWMIIVITILCWGLSVWLISTLAAPGKDSNEKEWMLQGFAQQIWPEFAQESMSRLKLLMSKKQDTSSAAEKINKQLAASAWMLWGADVIDISQDLDDHLLDDQVKSVIAHEVRQTRQWWTELNNPAGFVGFLILVLSPWYALSAAVIVSIWVGAWIAEIDADRYAYEVSGGSVYASVLEGIAKVWDYQGGHMIGDPHPHLHKRIARAKDFTNENHSVKTR